MSVKDKLYDKIKEKAKRREKLSEEIAQRNNNVEAFVMSLLDELDTDLARFAGTDLLQDTELLQYYVNSIQERVRILDGGSTVSVSWAAKTKEEQPRVNGLLIRWSVEYQVANNCEPELFVDIFSLLLKD